MDSTCATILNQNQSQPIPNVTGCCPICLEAIGLKNCCITECGHCFHASCLLTGILINRNCPLCRTALVAIKNTADGDAVSNDDDAVSNDGDAVSNDGATNEDNDSELNRMAADLNRLTAALITLEEKFRSEGDALALNTSLAFRFAMYYSPSSDVLELENIAGKYYNSPIDPEFPDQTISWDFYQTMYQIIEIIKSAQYAS